MQLIFEDHDVRERAHFLGVCKDQELVNVYHAMDVFSFTSQSETQGMVLAEAMAAGTPVVALDAPGVRDIVEHEQNGLLLMEEDTESFARALGRLAEMNGGKRDHMLRHVEETAKKFSAENSAQKTLALYRELQGKNHLNKKYDGDDSWNQLLRSVKREWTIWENRVSAGVDSISESEGKPDE